VLRSKICEEQHVWNRTAWPKSKTKVNGRISCFKGMPERFRVTMRPVTAGRFIQHHALKFGLCSGATQVISRFTVHGSRSTVHGPRFTIHDSRFTVHGPRFTIHDSRFTIHGSRFTVHANFTVHGYGWQRNAMTSFHLALLSLDTITVSDRGSGSATLPVNVDFFTLRYGQCERSSSPRHAMPCDRTTA